MPISGDIRLCSLWKEAFIGVLVLNLLFPKYPAA